MSHFPTLHADDIGTKVVGYVYSQPVVLYYPEAAEARAKAWARHLIDLGRENARS